MAQINKTFVFENNLGLCSDSFKFPKSGIAERFYNVTAKDSIVSNFSFQDLASLIDKNNANSINDALEQINITNVFGFSTYDDGNFVEYVMFSTSDNKVYYYDINDINRSVKSLNSINLTSTPKFETFINGGSNHLLISSKTDEMWVWNGVDNPYEVLDAPKILSLTVGLDRVFVLTLDNLYSVYYSDTFDPTEWSMSSGEGVIDFSDNMGKVLSVVSLDNYIFVIRDFGIVKISGGKNGGAFTISKMYFSSGKIFANTICSNGDYIVFVSSSGMYKFDGINCKKIYDEISHVYDLNEGDSAISFDGEYYLLTSKNSQKFVVVIDLNSDIVCSTITTENIVGLFSLILNNYRYVGILSGDENSAKMPYSILKNTQNLPKLQEFLYKTINIKLSPNEKIKTLRKINLLSKTDIKLKVITDLETYEFEISASDYIQSKKLSILFNNFSLEFYGSSGADISNISIEYSYVGGA